ncbi:monovalent cation/H+ antiporter subunit A [Advenella alkanexedens]|jgi:multicomponent K+:H+ antiporter subunit A|uniref:Monovalent cation/H+ antiporter subunit A n=1 Tax=Advenella alkanexedens TaxID=1481665 RepID=A0ABS6NNR7_9BURK|nr:MULTISPECIES: monovalent cation/H+ antiporter subunit A [Advenella]MBV4397272.1 monovalent cation/H+ antiporter subunit A [Advenella alkanexedens]MDD3757793.1 monovalent cation/H+ antiporter subunit A [Advenella sp.]NLN67237.1 monovalent cation/H+ antiporter subunit A [Alcaligenaceae bacterium]
MPLVLIVVLPFLGSILAAILPHNARNQESWLAGIIALVCAGMVIYAAPAVFNGEVLVQTISWLPSMGVNMTFRMDGFAWLFSLLVTIMGALVVLYARYYMDPADPVPRFFSFFLAFMGSMLGVVLSGNVIQLVIFWELTSLSSFMLIAYWHHRQDARRGARMALTITAAGGFCLLAGMLMIGHIVGSYELNEILASGNLIRNHPWYIPILVLIALGGLTKSAQFPFHFWLPNAMAAPTPVSAYLHSATMVKAGVFILARFWPVLASTDQWFWIIGGAGMCSLLIGAFAATFQQDMKGVLAYSTISHLGLTTLLLGLNSELALIAAIFHMINHATFKASLFMATGIVDHETGTRDMGVLSGLRKAMPITATLAIVASAAMAGVPLLNGFLSKEMFFSETLFVNQTSYAGYWLPSLAVLASSFSVAYSLRFIIQVFFGKPATDLPRKPHDPPHWMLFPSAVLVLLCILIGVFPELIIGSTLKLAATSILGDHLPAYSLAIWHGFNLPLVMSILALVGGVSLLYVLKPLFRSYPGQTPILYRFDGRKSFDAVMNGIDSIAYILLEWFSSKRLQPQVLWIVVITVVVGMLPLLGGNWLHLKEPFSFDPAFALLWTVGGACAIGAAYLAKYNRFRALVLSGGAGLVTCITFAWLSAPDLALTQLVVETVTVVLILLGLRWLPRRVIEESQITPLRSFIRRFRDLAIAICSGLGLSALVYIMLTRDKPEGLSAFFLEKALPEGGGNNVVNVILVDFRGFDTYGEISVLGIVAITVYALLRRFRPPQESIHALENRHEIQTIDGNGLTNEHSLPKGILLAPNVLGRLMLPVITLISLYFLLRGHNLPGGGFVGGLIFATGIILQYMLSGIHWVETRSRVRPQYWISVGLLIAGGSSMLAWWVGQPFLSAISWDIYLPVIGKLHLSSVILFDIGVYALVVGATTFMLVALAHQSLRFYRKAPVAESETKAGTGTQLNFSDRVN